MILREQACVLTLNHVAFHKTPNTYITVLLNWAVVVHAFNLYTQEAEAIGSWSLRSSWSTEVSFQTADRATQRNSYLEKPKQKCF